MFKLSAKCHLQQRWFVTLSARPCAFIVAAVIFSVSCLHCASAQEDKPIAGVQDLAIDARLIPNLTSQALAGSGTAAQRLFMHYRFVALEENAARYWLRIAAENDNATAQMNYAQTLWDSRRTDAHIRALYWARRALKTGGDDEAAKAFLKEHRVP